MVLLITGYTCVHTSIYRKLICSNSGSFVCSHKCFLWERLLYYHLHILHQVWRLSQLQFSSPCLQCTDWINLCNIDDGSKSFQSCATAFSNLQQKQHTISTLLCVLQLYIALILEHQKDMMFSIYNYLCYEPVSLSFSIVFMLLL